MIGRIYSGIEERCSAGWCGEKIRFFYKAYGAGYDFCRFYETSGGILLVYNSNLTADCAADDELLEFIGFVSPHTVEIMDISPEIDGMEKTVISVMSKRSTEFISPENTDDVIKNQKLDNIYDITEKCFGETDRGLWYTHISHCVRHGLSDTFLIEDTASARTDFYHSFAYLSDIAVVPEMRKRGYFRRIVSAAENAAFERYPEVRLCASEELTAMYRHIGYREIGRGNYFTKKDD